MNPIKCKDCRYKYHTIHNTFGCYQYWNLFKKMRKIEDLETIPKWCPIGFSLYKEAIERCNSKFKEVKE